jgi:orotidine-5'-phosphate decarboxylase
MAINKPLIKEKKSIIVALDVSELKKAERIVKETCRIEGIGGYKIGLALTLIYGLPQIISLIRKITNLPIIYDHQKGGTDIPEIGEIFAANCKKAGLDGVILFPFSGKQTEIYWIDACQKNNLTVLVGAHMTHPTFLISEGGFIDDYAPEKIFQIAAEKGIKDFVVPGNKPEYIEKYRNLLENILGKGNFTFYAPGFVTQGGEISETGKVAGEKWHAIVGSAIYKANNFRKAALTLTSEIKKLNHQ